MMALPAQAEQAFGKLEDLLHAVKTLKSKTIPQAYFWLGSPGIPDSTLFVPDTKGGAFVIITKGTKAPEGTERNFYKDDAWRRLLEAVQRWTVLNSEISDLAKSNQWTFTEDSIVTLRIPDSSGDFFPALLKGWATNEENFRCEIHWN